MKEKCAQLIKKQGLLLLVLIVGAFLRFYHLSSESLYGDEAYSIYHAQQTIEEATPVFLYDQNPPLHVILLHFWMKVFGVSDFSAKALSALFSVLAAGILFLFARKFLNKTTALLVSFLFLFSNAQQFYSTEARTYAFVQFLCVASFYCYFKLMEGAQKWDIFFLFLINLALLFSHYLTIYIFVVQFLCCFLFFKQNRKGVFFYLGSQVLVVLAFLPWLKIMLANIPQNGSFWNKIPNYAEFRWHVNVLMGSENLFCVFNILVLCSLLMLVLNKRFKFYDELFKSNYYLVFLLLYLLPILLNFYVAQITPVFLNRYVLYSTIGLFLLIGYCIANLNSTRFVKGLIALSLFYVLFVSFEIKQEREDDWKSLVPMIKKEQTNKTLIFVSASYKIKEFSFYYDRNAFCDYRHTPELLAKQRVFYFEPTQFTEWSKLDYNNVNKIVYVQSHSQFEDPDNKIKQLIIDKGFTASSFFQKRNGAYTVFVKNRMNL